MRKTYTFEWEGLKCTLQRATIGDAIERDKLVVRLDRRPYSVALANFLTQTVSIEGDFAVPLLKSDADLAALEDAYNKWKTVDEPFVVAWQDAQVKVSASGEEKKLKPSENSGDG